MKFLWQIGNQIKYQDSRYLSSVPIVIILYVFAQLSKIIIFYPRISYFDDWIFALCDLKIVL
jgi:hypothetical protein